MLTWYALPDTNIAKARLGNATRFAYVWLANIAPDLNHAKAIGVGRFQANAPWFKKFFKPAASALGRMMGGGGEELPDFNDPQEQGALSVITDWCLDYMRWLSDIHQCGDEVIALFDPSCLSRAKGVEVIPDELSRLVRGVETDLSKQEGDSIPEIKRRLDDSSLAAKHGKGMVGLARALYATCSL